MSPGILSHFSALLFVLFLSSVTYSQPIQNGNDEKDVKDPIRAANEKGEEAIDKTKPNEFNPEVIRFFFGPNESKDRMPKYFSLYPGFNTENNSLHVKGNGNESHMGSGRAQFNWLLDLKSKEFQFSEWSGVHLLIHSSEITMNTQSVQVASASDSAEKSEYIDVGTRIRGNYSMFVPMVYLGRANEDSWRFGIGAGPARLRMTGSTDFFNNNYFAYYITGLDSPRSDFLNQLSTIQIINGNIDISKGDPIVNYLIVNLSQGNNLELLGLYYASKGLLNTDPFLLFFAGGNPQYSALDILTLNSLARSQVNISRSNVISIMGYIETGKIGPIKLRLSFGGMGFRERGYYYELSSFQFSAYMPIEF